VETNSIKQILKPKELGAYLKVSPSTLRQWERSGLKTIRLGSKKFYAETDVVDFLLSRRHQESET